MEKGFEGVKRPTVVLETKVYFLNLRSLREVQKKKRVKCVI